MEYTKQIVEHYTKHRDSYRSTDKIIFPLAKKLGIKNKVILDFGCGHGVDTMKFVKLGAKKVVGIDPSKAMIDLAKRHNHHRKIEFIKTDGKKLPLKNNQFDLVFANFVVHYLEDTKKQFTEIARVLNQGGYFLAIFNCLTSDVKLINKRVPMVLGKGENSTRIHIMSKSAKEIKDNLMAAGFKIIKFTNISNPDAKIDPHYNNKHKFKKQPKLLVALKI